MVDTAESMTGSSWLEYDRPISSRPGNIQGGQSDEVSAKAVLYATLLRLLVTEFVALPDKPEETPETTLRALWLHAAGDPRSAEAALSIDLPNLADEATNELRGAIDRRLSGVPLAHITGRQRFLGVDFLASPDALIPRRETEILGRAAEDKLKATITDRGDVRIADVCTGSGNLAITLALGSPSCVVEATDISEAALRLAALNAAHHNVRDRVSFVASDLFACFEDGAHERVFDLMVANPPYISSGRLKTMASEIADHEPALAFDGGGFGLSIIDRLINQAPRFLKASSWFLFEVGAGQGARIRSSLQRSGAYSEIQTFEDEAGRIRALAALTI